MLDYMLASDKLPKCVICAVPEYWNQPIVPPNDDEEPVVEEPQS